MTKRIFYTKPIKIEALPKSSFSILSGIQKFLNKQQRNKIMNPNLVFAVRITEPGGSVWWAYSQNHIVAILAKAKLWCKLSTARRVRTLFRKRRQNNAVVEVIEINLSEGQVVKD